MTEISGGCFCGAVRYTATEPPIATRTCWCRLCQYLAAGSSTVNTFFNVDSITFDGERTHFERVADSGTAIHSSFCPKCGTQLTTSAPSRPTIVGVRVGSLDDPESFAPQSTIWASAAPSWACLDPDLPVSERQPPPLA